MNNIKCACYSVHSIADHLHIFFQLASDQINVIHIYYFVDASKGIKPKNTPNLDRLFIDICIFRCITFLQNDKKGKWVLIFSVKIKKLPIKVLMLKRNVQVFKAYKLSFVFTVIFGSMFDYMLCNTCRACRGCRTSQSVKGKLYTKACCSCRFWKRYFKLTTDFCISICATVYVAKLDSI